MATCKISPENPLLKEEKGTLKSKSITEEVPVKVEEVEKELEQQWTNENHNCYRPGKPVLSGCTTRWTEKAWGKVREYEYDLSKLDTSDLDELVEDLKQQRANLKDTGVDCPYTSSSTFRYSTQVWRPDNKAGSNPYSNGTYVTSWKEGTVSLNCCDSDYARYTFGEINIKTNPDQPDPAEEWIGTPKEGTTSSIGKTKENIACSCGDQCKNTSGGSTSGASPNGNEKNRGRVQDQTASINISMEQEYTKKSCCR